MRVSNDTLRNAFLIALQKTQSQIADTQAQIGTGKRLNKPSDDPIAAASAAHFEATLSRNDQYRANGVIARNQLGLEEQALGGVIDHLQRIRELVLQANSAGTSDSDRKIIAAEIQQNRDALVALGNTTDAEGHYLFGGYSETGRPFSVGATGTVTYNGDQGQRTLQINDGRFVVINDSGASVFQKIKNGNGTFALTTNPANTGTGVLGAGTVVNAAAYVADTYAINFLTPTTYEVRDGVNALVTNGTFQPPANSIQFRGMDIQLDGAPTTGDSFTVAPSSQSDLFVTIDATIAAVGNSTIDPAVGARTHGEIGQRLADLDQAINHVIDTRSEIGARVQAIDQEDALGQQFTAQLTQTLSSIRDLDYAAALSRLSQQMVGLQAAQQSFAQTQGLSLFRYLG